MEKKYTTAFVPMLPVSDDGCSILLWAQPEMRILYEVEGADITDRQMRELNAAGGRAIGRYIAGAGGTLRYMGYTDITVFQLLESSDDIAPELLETCCRKFYLDGVTEVRRAVELITEENERGIILNEFSSYEESMKTFLADLSARQLFDSVWPGELLSKIVLEVKSHGTPHLFDYHENSNELRQYLYDHTRFAEPADCPAKLYRNADGSIRLDLYMEIRID